MADTIVHTVQNKAQFTGYWFPYSQGGVSYLLTINAGSYFEFNVSGASSVNVEVWSPDNTGNRNYLAYQINGGTITRFILDVSFNNVYNIITGLNSGITNNIKIYCSAIQENNPVWYSAWGIGIKDITVNAGTITPATDTRDVMLCIGDSITAGVHLLAGATGGRSLYQAAELAFSTLTGNQLNYRTVVHGFGATGVSVSGSGSVPKAAINVFNYMDGIALANELTPKVILVNLGTNDTAQADATVTSDYSNLVDLLKARYPTSKVYLIRPTNGGKASVIQAVASAKSVNYIDTSSFTGITTTDGTHPNQAGSVNFANQLAPLIITNVPIMVKKGKVAVS